MAVQNQINQKNASTAVGMRMAVDFPPTRANMVSTKGGTMRSTAIAFPLEDLIGWERSMVAFLVEKERRSGSKRTVQGYSSMLQDFFGRLGAAAGSGVGSARVRMGTWTGGLRS